MPRQRRALIRRGDVWDAAIPVIGNHPVVVVTRDRAIPLLSRVVCVLVTSTFHHHVAEVALGRDEGLTRDCAANCDNLFTVPVACLTRHRGHLGFTKLAQLDTALTIALGLDHK